MLELIIESVLLGVGLAMDAFSVSVVHAMNRPAMRTPERVRIALCFAFFQWLMPLLGYLFVSQLVGLFAFLGPWIPRVSCAVLCVLGAKMLAEGIRGGAAGEEERVGSGTLLAEGIATSLDALSAGFAFAAYRAPQAVAAACIIALVTYLICRLGLRLGGTVGARLAEKAPLLGGVILIVIGLRILFH